MARTRREEAGPAEMAPDKPRRPEAKAFAEIAAKSKSFRPARETLRRVRAVPTIFPDVDRATRIGGWPTERVCVVHGPSSHGKTQFCHGLGKSFLQRGHMYCLIDAECTTPHTWVRTLLGEELADSPAFVASRPDSYEQAVDDVRKVARALVEMRESKKLPPETSALFVVDSIRKLVPEDLIARIKRDGAAGAKGSVDGYGGAAGRMRAQLNAAWLDELVPLMYRTGCSVVFINREAEDPNADAADRKFGNDWKMTGGKALEFDSSLIARIERAGFVYPGGKRSGDEETRKTEVAVGERHKVTIRKTKVAAKQDREEVAYFYTSNGMQVPEGFDRARDLLALGDELGVLKRSGSWISFERSRWQGEAKFVVNVAADALDRIEAKCREKFAADAREHADIVGSA